MSKPEVVVFDLGKVLLDFNYGVAIAKIASRSGCEPARLRTLIDQSPLLHRFETGLMTEEQFFEEVRKSVGFPGTLAEFEEIFADIFTPIPEMIELHASLRARGVATFIFSNTNGFAVRHIRRNYPFFANFDGYILSYEHGSMKPSTRLYEVVEETTGRSGPSLLYLDDRPENIDTARLRGWHTVVHSRPDETAAIVRAAGLLG